MSELSNSATPPGSELPLQVGVIGLGRAWTDSYQPALAARSDRFVVTTVCDPVSARTAHATRHLGCAVAAGAADLLERPDVEALLLLETGWQGLWPLERAAVLGKPALCLPPLSIDGPHAEAVVEAVRSRGVAVVTGLLPRLTPAFARLRELAETRLEPVRLVLCDTLTSPDRDGDEAGLLDLCGLLLGTPRSVQAGPRNDAHAVLLLDCGDGRSAQVTRRRALHSRTRTRVEVIGERGWATCDLRGRLRWGDAEGIHSLRLADTTETAGVLLERFHGAVRRGCPPEPGLEDAVRVFVWSRSARRGG